MKGGHMKAIINTLAIPMLAVLLMGQAVGETRCTREANGSITCREYSTPSSSDLERIYGPGNPEAYLQGRRQVEQSNSLQAEALRQQQLANERAALANQFEAQNNALRLENKRLKNEALQNQNKTASSPASTSSQYAVGGRPITSAQMDRLRSATDAEMAQMSREAETLSADSDPTKRARGERLSQFVRIALEIRR